MKVMICQPKNGLSEKKIDRVRTETIERLARKGIKDVANSSFKYSEGYLMRKGVKHLDVHQLAVEVMNSATCDLIYFCKGWKDDTACVILHEIAERYGFDIFEEDASSQR